MQWERKLDFLKSMILGQRWELPSEIRIPFLKTGNTHIGHFRSSCRFYNDGDDLFA